MVVVAEVSLDPTDFPLGSMLTTNSGIQIEFERLVPVGGNIVPAFWAWGDDIDMFEQHIRENPQVRELTALDRIDDRVLYLLNWESTEKTLLKGFTENEGLIRHVESDGTNWTFELLFPSYDHLTAFHNLCVDHDVALVLGRIHALDEAEVEQLASTITTEQRNALVLALQHGYFETPSQVTLSELAETLDISQQALSDRIRRGTKAILEQSLFSDLKSHDGE